MAIKWENLSEEEKHAIQEDFRERREAKTFSKEQIKDMLKTLPSGVTVNFSDLKEIYSQEEICAMT